MFHGFRQRLAAELPLCNVPREIERRQGLMQSRGDKRPGTPGFSPCHCGWKLAESQLLKASVRNRSEMESAARVMTPTLGLLKISVISLVHSDAKYFLGSGARSRPGKAATNAASVHPMGKGFDREAERIGPATSIPVRDSDSLQHTGTFVAHN